MGIGASKNKKQKKAKQALVQRQEQTRLPKNLPVASYGSTSSHNRNIHNQNSDYTSMNNNLLWATAVSSAATSGDCGPSTHSHNHCSDGNSGGYSGGGDSGGGGYSGGGDSGGGGGDSGGGGCS